MTLVSSCGDTNGLPRLSLRTLSTALRRVSLSGLAVALVCLLAAPAAAEPAVCPAESVAMATPVAWSRPIDAADPTLDWSYAQFRGLSCERCDTRTHYCVVNFVRWEYVCAPRGNTFACAGSAGTRWCRLGQTCWDGVCR